MSYLVVLIVNDIDKCPAVLDAWEKAGVTGVTILNSSGLGHLRLSGLRDDIPLLPDLDDLLGSDEIDHRTLISVVAEQGLVDQMVELTQKIIGDLEEPDTGFLFVIPGIQAYGLKKRR